MESSMILELRFQEFPNEEHNNLKKYRFEDIFLFSTGKNIKQREASPEFETPCVRYGELYHMYNEVIYEIVNRTNLDKSELYFSEGNEILLPSAGEDPLDIGSASALTIKNIAIGRTINILKPKIESLYSQIFVSYYINQQLKKKISSLAKGVSISNVYNSDLKKLDITLPALPEQTKIANFLTAVDKRINLLQKKKAELTQYKKGVMQKLFSQEIRFKKDDGSNFSDWEEKKLGEVCDVRDGTHDSPKYYNEGYPLITSKNLRKDGKLNFDDINNISKEDYLAINKRSGVNIGDILFGMIGTIGNPVIVDSIGFAIKNVALIKEKKELINSFLIHYLNSKDIQKQFHQLNTGNTQKFVALGVIRELKIILPSLPEQQKIASFLSSIDKQIEKVGQQIEASQQWKKGLLQKMFV